jgi:prepilin-type N-terminal cleavage/methylation domain-containing protein
MVSVLKENEKMRKEKKRCRSIGFTLLETMIALVVLGVGVLGLAAMLADSLAYMQGSQDDFIAQQKAEEAAEAIYTAKYTNTAPFSAISNFGVGNPGGLFLPGALPLLQPGTDGLVGSVADVGQPPEYILYPGPDNKLGTGDDVKVPLSNFTRTITITDVPGYTTLRRVDITMNYTSGRFNRTYTLTTYVSEF